MKKKLFQKHLCALLLISFTNKAVYSGCSENFCENARIIPEREVTTFVPMGDWHPLRYDHHKIEYTLDEECSWRAQATIAYRYYHSFHNDKLAAVMLFPERYDGGSSLLSFQGTNFTQLSTPARNPAALVAEYFGLGSATNSSLTIEPSITYNTIDMSFNFGFDNICKGLYLHLGVPVQNARFVMQNSEPTALPGTTLPEGFIKNEFVSGTDPVSDYFTDTVSTVKPVPSLLAGLDGAVVGDMKPKRYGLFKFSDNNDDGANYTDSNNCGSDSTWGLANLYIQLGWDMLQTDTSYAGGYILAVAPTGTKINAEWSKNIFSPVVGNGHHWELGLGVNARTDLYTCEDKWLRGTFDGYITHLFATEQVRYFDLKNKPLSRFCLAKAYVASDEAFNSNDFTYQNALYSIADLTAQCVDVYVPVKGEFIVEIEGGIRNWNGALGYAFSGQQGEHIKSCGVDFNNSDKYVYGLFGAAGVQEPSLSNTSSADTIWTNYFIQPDATAYSPGSATTPYSFPVAGVTNPATYGIPVSRTNILTAQDIDIDSALMRKQIISRLYADAGYTWKDYCWEPSLNVMGSIGFSQMNSYTPELWDLGISFSAAY